MIDLLFSTCNLNLEFPSYEQLLRWTAIPKLSEDITHVGLVGTVDNEQRLHKHPLTSAACRTSPSKPAHKSPGPCNPKQRVATLRRLVPSC